MRSPTSPFNLRAALSHEVGAAMEALAEDDGGRKAVHRCRVRLRRARTLARVGHTVAPGLSDVFNDSARGLMRGLASARELTALAKTARGLAKRSERKAAAGLKAIAATLDAARAALPEIDYATVNAGLRDLLALAHVWPEASPRQIKRGALRVERRARKAWRKGRKAGASADYRHAWRQRERDRLYAVTLLGNAWPDRRPRRRGQSKKVVEVLGEERDAMLLASRIEAAPPVAGEEKAAAGALRALRQRQAQLGRRARKAAARLRAPR